MLFSAIQRIPIEVDEDPSQSFMAQFPYGTLDTTVAHIIHMKDYTTFETAKVISRLFFFFTCDFSSFSFSFSFFFFCLIMIFVASRW